MAPFLGPSLKDLLLTLMGHFIKKDVMEQADSYPKLAAIDPCDKKNQVHCKHVEFGFAARRSLKSVTDNKTISELAVLTFKTECVQLLSAMTAKLIERCPLKYPLVTYHQGHFTKLPLTPAMKRHVMSARMRYGQYLDEQKKESLNEQQRKKWKGVQLSIREAERKKSMVDTSIDILGKEADDLAKSAETKHDFTLLTKSNALRLKVAQQSQEIPKLEKELKELGVNSIIYSVALPFSGEIKQKLNKLYVAKYYCYSHVIYYI